jgi:hypothetical protein
LVSASRFPSCSHKQRLGNPMFRWQQLHCCVSFHSVQVNSHMTNLQCSYTDIRWRIRRVDRTGCLPKHTPQTTSHHSTQPRPIVGPQCRSVGYQELHSTGFVEWGARSVRSGIQGLSDRCYRIWWRRLHQCFWIQIYEHPEDELGRGPELDLLNVVQA